MHVCVEACTHHHAIVIYVKVSRLMTSPGLPSRKSSEHTESTRVYNLQSIKLAGVLYPSSECVAPARPGGTTPMKPPR